MRHHIQRNILNTLATSEHLRYSDIKPADLDGNVFGYHLKSVISDNYVDKTSGGLYTLTAKGRDYIVHRYENSSRSAHSIFLIVVKNGSNYLLRRRKVQPMLGYKGFIHGEPDPDVSVVEAAKNRLLDKAGIATDLRICGSTLLTQYRDDELHSYSHAIILSGETNDDFTKSEDETGKNLWSSLDNTENLLPSCHDIIDMIKTHGYWLEKTYRLD